MKWNITRRDVLKSGMAGLAGVAMAQTRALASFLSDLGLPYTPKIKYLLAGLSSPFFHIRSTSDS